MRNQVLSQQVGKSGFLKIDNPAKNKDSQPVLHAKNIMNNAYGQGRVINEYVIKQGDVICTNQGKYVAYDALGSGARGAAILVQNVETLQFEVLKIGYVTSLRAYGGLKDSFEREAGILSSLQQEQSSVSPKFTEFEQGPFSFCTISQEFSHGQTGDRLCQALNEGNKTIAEKEIVNMFATGLQELMHLSNTKNMHLDIKPENMMWDEKSKTLKFLDYGEGRSVDTAKSLVSLIGTKQYAAPELSPHTSGRDAVDRHYSEQCDIYSFGVSMNEFLSVSKVEGPIRQDFQKLIDNCLIEDPNQRITVE